VRIAGFQVQAREDQACRAANEFLERRPVSFLTSRNQRFL
jgi:hypothetical protein